VPAVAVTLFRRQMDQVRIDQDAVELLPLRRVEVTEGDCHGGARVVERDRDGDGCTRRFQAVGLVAKLRRGKDRRNLEKRQLALILLRDAAEIHVEDLRQRQQNIDFKPSASALDVAQILAADAK